MGDSGHWPRLGAMVEILTMRIAVGGSVSRTIMAASHLFLFDSAYARKAEKAGRDRFAH